MNGFNNKKIIAAVVVFFSFSLFVFGQSFTDRELKKNVMPVRNALASVQQLHLGSTGNHEIKDEADGIITAHRCVTGLVTVVQAACGASRCDL